MLTATVVAVVLVAGPATAQTPTFPDVPVGHPFYTEITWAAAAGITTGYGDGTFRPSATVTRQAAVAFTHRLWLADGNTDPDPLPDPGFSDLGPGHPFYTDIAWAADAGITTGYSDGTFRSGATVTRQAAVAFTHRLWLALGNADPDPLPDPGFTDVAAGHPFYDDIAWAADAGITTGYGDGTFRPSAVVTRQADMAFLYRLAASIGLVFTVDTATDAVDTDPGDGNCDIGDGTCSLRAAIDETNAGPLAETITIAPGVNPTLTIAGADEDNNATGDLDITGPLTIDGGGATIDADGIDRVIDHHAGQLALTNATITGGNTTGDGGGINARSGTVAVLSGITITNNTADDGGGINADATTTITNVTIADNAAAGNGGGLYSESGTVTILNATIVDNTANLGGGVRGGASATVQVTSSVLAANLGGDCVGQVTSGGYNLDSSLSCPFDDPTDLAAQDPLLAPLADNGGPTPTRLPYADSPLVDAIPFGVNGCGTTIAVDQRGVARPDGAGCDIGAVEGTGPTAPPPLDLTVDTAVDAIDTNPGDGVCDIGDGTCSLRAAIQETNARPTTDTITIATGINPTLTIAGVDEDDSATGDLDIRDTLTIEGGGATIDAAGLDRVIDHHIGQLAITNLTVTGGATTSDGGGINTRAGTYTALTDTTITNNNADNFGGGIYTLVNKIAVIGGTIDNNTTGNRGGGIAGVYSTVTTNSTTIADNTAQRGGGVSGFGFTASLTDTTVRNNTADWPISSSPSGGGVYSIDGSLTIDNTTITNNTASRNGGGLYNRNGPLTITEATITDNTAIYSGGGLYNIDGPLTIDNTTITNNIATLDGGGVNNNGGSLTIDNTTISNNTATRIGGGGIVHAGNVGTITNTTITNNTAGQVGGGLLSNSDTTTILNSTVADNMADTGGGIYPGPTAVVQVMSSVVASNLGGDCGGQVVSDGYNLDRDGSCPFDDPTDLAAQAPLLGPFADNGGPTLTYLPYADSPLVDAIPPGANGCGTTVTADQRGMGRPDGSGCDIGAVEGTGPVAPPPLDLTVDTATDAVDTAPGDGACDIGDGTCSIRAAIQETNALPAADTITIDAGINPTLTIGGIDEELSASGDLDIRGPLTIVGGGATIDAQGMDRVIDHHIGQLTIANLTITGGNTTGDGGGINTRIGTSTALTGTTITNNTASGGGGVYSAPGTITIDNATITNNTASGSGGGIYTLAGTITITDTTITNNTASGSGGGIYNDRSAATITNTTITNNTTVSRGGGIYGRRTSDTDPTVTITNTTITNNTANVTGGGMYQGSFSTPTLVSSVVATNSGGDCSGGSPITGGYNLDTDGSCGFNDPTDRASQDPLLGPLADNGGPTLTRLPYADSPLLDAIPPGANGCGTTVAADQRGQPRPEGTGCDIGAVERPGLPSPPLSLTVDTATDAVDTNPGDSACDVGDGTCSLRAAIQETNALPGTDTITIAAGINPTLTIDGINEELSASGDLDIRGPLTIVGGGATIDAAGIDRVIDHHIGQLTITNLTITGGNTTSLGGGIYNRSGTLATLSELTITDNTAVRGGGIYNTVNATVTVAHATITNNTADRGGGIYNTSNATVAVANATITNNTADSGGGIYNTGTTTFQSSAVATNGGDGCSGDSPVSGGYNLGSDGSCGFDDPTDLVSGNPLLGPLADNGGPTLTRLPYADSPLVDAIPPGANGCGTTLVTDQRGVARPDGAGCDIGAVEGTGPNAPPLSLTVDTAIDAGDTNAGNGACDIGDGRCSLRAAIDETNASPTADTVTIAPGIDPTLSLSGTDEDTNTFGDLDIVDDLTIVGGGATIDAAGIDRVIDHQAGQLTITNTTITGGNTTAGGGIYSRDGALTIDNTTIANNTARYGGGVYNVGTATIVNATITSNTSQLANKFGYGGAIYNRGTATITNTTIAANAADNIGGIYNGGAATLLSSAVAANVGGDCAGSILTGGYNLGSDGSCGFADPTDLAPQDAVLGLLADNGGPTPTLMPYADSPLVDAVPPGANGCGTTVTVDQRGVTRPDGAGCDIGAVEGSGPVALPPVSLTVDSAADAVDTAPGDGICDIGDGTCSLRAAIQETNVLPAADTITIAPGINPALTIAGAGEDDSATGDLDIVDDLTINGNGATIDANGIDRVIDQQIGQLAITDVTLTGAYTTDWGGAISTRNGQTVTTISDAVITNNRAGIGGGVYSAEGAMTITNTTISDNTSIAASGAGLYIKDGTATIEGVAISGNTSAGHGGGISNSRGTVTITNSTIADNAATSSPGIGGKGGGIFNNVGTVTLTNTTITDNSTTGTGGGISTAASATTTVLSSVVASNAGGDCSGAQTTGGFNLDSDGSCGFVDPSDLVSGDPLLGPLADNGGPTPTRLPFLGSPLIDAIAPGANGCGTTVTVDQRGVARPAGAGCDVGAVEGVGPPPP